jgi:hypothetical protein
VPDVYKPFPPRDSDSEGMEGKPRKIFGSNSKVSNSKVSNSKVSNSKDSNSKDSNYTFGIDSGQKYSV